MKKIIILIIVAALYTLFTGCASKQSAEASSAQGSEVTFVVSYEGPGGHSSGAYGRVNAVHAAARTIVALEDAKPAVNYKVKEFSGGNSVNSIAFNGKVVVSVSGSAEDIATFTKALEAAVAKGVDEENKFRNVTPGATDKTGRRMDVRANIAKN